MAERDITSMMEEALKAVPDSTNSHDRSQDELSSATNSFGSSAFPEEALRPALPPGLAIHSGKTSQQILTELNKTPLFMTEMEDNDDIAALQALAYEGSALENSAGFKDRGNECFKARDHNNAREFYKKGILLLAAEEAKRKRGQVTKNPDGIPDDENEIKAQRSMLDNLYTNKAACELELRNYRSCWLDCVSALKLNPSNIKACYRSARALLAVDRINEADEICALGLSLDEDNPSLRQLADDIIRRAQAVIEKRQEEEERVARKKRREMVLKAALRARNIQVTASPRPPDMEDAKMELVPDPEDPRSQLSIPTIFLYPLHYESDFIRSFKETECLDQHLDYVFPLPWDEKEEYLLNDVTVQPVRSGKDGAKVRKGVESYVETKEGGLLKLGKKVPLIKMLSMGRTVLLDGLLRVYVLPGAGTLASDWVRDWKIQKAKLTRSGG